MEAEARAARERAVVPLETRIRYFLDMLYEKEVSDSVEDLCIIIIIKFSSFHYFFLLGVCFQYVGERVAQNSF